MVKRKIIRLFESRKGHLEYRVKRDFIRNGIAVIPCRISEYSDVISTYSVKGYETLNPDFYEYLETTADVTPSDSPIVLHIIEDCLSQAERKTIEETILDDCSYNRCYLSRSGLWVKLCVTIFFLQDTIFAAAGDSRDGSRASK